MIQKGIKEQEFFDVNLLSSSSPIPEKRIEIWDRDSYLESMEEKR